jgi:hypothetical protein
MPPRRSFDFANTLSPALLGREIRQLAIVAGLTLLAFIFAPGWLKLIAGVVDLVVVLICVVGLIVASRKAGLRSLAAAVYAIAAAVFLALGVLNLAA